MELGVGDEFAGCRIQGVLGAGGMGVVYRGTDLRLERPVAIKLIATDRAGDEAARRRFAREARLMAAIDHPNVIPVYAAGEQDGDLYLVMRYVAGTDLHRRIRQEGALTPAETARVIAQVARALDAAHARGLVHRDIKPANVLLSGEHVYLTDFGITRLVDESNHTTETGDWVGTLDFMSPEHLRGEETDARSDVYSLGCVLYTCLTGVAPFKRATSAATITAHLQERPPLPSHIGGPRGPIPAAFDQVVGRALAKAREQRYASAGDLAEAVSAAAEGRPNRWGRAPRFTAVAPEAGLPREIQDVRAARQAGPVQRPGAGRPSGSEAGTVRAPSEAQTARATHTATRRQAPDMVPTLRVSAATREPTRRPLLLGAAALSLVVAAVVVLLALHNGRAKPVQPFSSVQVSDVVGQFAAAYSSHDAAALAALLAPDVTRVDPINVERGARAVLADYRSQFATRPVPTSYRLSGLLVTPGWVGRASGTYAVTLSGGSVLRGHVTFAVQRIAQRTVIGLIVTQQDSVG